MTHLNLHIFFLFSIQNIFYIFSKLFCLLFYIPSKHEKQFIYHFTIFVKLNIHEKQFIYHFNIFVKLNIGVSNVNRRFAVSHIYVNCNQSN